MKVKTLQFGELEYNEEQVLNFEKGIFGFEELKKFLLIKNDEEIFYWLNSIEQPELAFPLIGIRMIDDEYPQREDYEAFGIVKFDKDPAKITVNLLAPVYINQEDKTGFQTILDNEKYPVEYPLFKQ